MLADIVIQIKDYCGTENRSRLFHIGRRKIHMMHHIPDGVLDASYARDRITRPELRWRLATRAAMVVDAARRHGYSRFGQRVLDMGCADGRAMLESSVQLPGSTFDGVEYSSDLVKAAVVLPESITIRQGDITELPPEIAAESYDIVSALAVLEHLPVPVLAVREAQRVLKPGGLFVATSPVRMWDRVSTCFGLLKGDAHISDMNRDYLMGLVREAGLKPLEYRKFMWAPVAFLPYLHILPSPRIALRIDRIVESLRFSNRMFVNQAIVAMKPLHEKISHPPKNRMKSDK